MNRARPSSCLSSRSTRSFGIPRTRVSRSFSTRAALNAALLPLNESGPNIQEGRRYTLSISRDWLDADGSPLAAAFDKPFHVVADERETVDPAKWRIATPREGTADPLVVTFPRPLDYALLQRTITVAGMAGKVAVARGETELRFTPDAPWIAGPHQLVVETTLEDLAGNRVGRPFDVDTFREVTQARSKSPLFQCRSGSVESSA